MRKHSFERLSAQDLSFLLMETPTVHMHLGSVNVYEAGPLRTPRGGIDVALYKKAIASILHIVPRFRQRLMWIPIENRPVWVDDPHFHLDYHIRHTALPRPGSDEQLKQLVGHVMEQQLDRARPLWEMWVVEGLSEDRFAVIAKYHHCLLDGIAGMDLAHVLFSTKPEYELREPPPFVPHAAPTGAELLRDSVWRRATLPGKLVSSLRTAARHPGAAGRDLLVRARALGEFLGTGLRSAPSTPFNGPLSPHRRIDWLTLPLAGFKAVSKACDCTLNDVFMATVAGAVREFLISRNVSPDEIDFRVSAPVNVRRQGERGRLGNRASQWFVELPIAEPDALRQLEILKGETRELKHSHQEIAFDMLMTLADWMPPVLLSLGMREADGATNMIITNVPGPQYPLYLLGARVLAFHPVVPLIENVGLGVAIISYNGQVHWGFTADYALMPDLRNFVEMMEGAFRTLAHAAPAKLEPTPAAAPKKVSHQRIPPPPPEPPQATVG